jgi:hypothetical protein
VNPEPITKFDRMTLGPAARRLATSALTRAKFSLDRSWCKSDSLSGLPRRAQRGDVDDFEWGSAMSSRDGWLSIKVDGRC